MLWIISSIEAICLFSSHQVKTKSVEKVATISVEQINWLVLLSLVYQFHCTHAKLLLMSLVKNNNNNRVSHVHWPHDYLIEVALFIFSHHCFACYWCVTCGKRQRELLSLCASLACTIKSYYFIKLISFNTCLTIHWERKKSITHVCISGQINSHMTHVIHLTVLLLLVFYFICFTCVSE